MITKNAFLTPTSLWEGFDDGLPLKEAEVNKIKVENTVMTELYFSGRAIESERVRIYGFYSVPESGRVKGALLYLSGENETIGFDSLKDFVAAGYAVLSVDLYGERNQLKNHTEYPQSVSYANIENCGRHKDFVDESAKETCWYEWVSVARYAVSFLKSKGYKKIGVIGDKTGANVGWQLVAFDKRVDCFVSLFGAGWTAYKDEYKYADDAEPERDESFKKYVAAVDAHAYAQYIKIPVLFLTSTNGEFMEFDRAGDTLSRIDKKVPCYYDFSVGYNAHLDEKSEKDVFSFLSGYLSEDGAELPQNPELTVSEKNGKLCFNVTADGSEKISAVKLAVNDGVIQSAYRTWKIYDMRKNENGEYEFGYTPLSERTFAFCRVEYENGTALSSKEACKRGGEIKQFVHRLVYSCENGLNGICFQDEKDGDGSAFLNRIIELKKGAFDISGVYSPDGLISYAFLENKFALNDNSLIKFDVYAEEYAVIRLTLYELDINGEIKEYSYAGEFKAEKLWQNSLVKITEFKSEVGITVKNYGGIIALGIKSESKFLINNVLVV